MAWLSDSQIYLMDRIYLENFREIDFKIVSANDQNRVGGDLYF